MIGTNIILFGNIISVWFWISVVVVLFCYREITFLLKRIVGLMLFWSIIIWLLQSVCLRKWWCSIGTYIGLTNLILWCWSSFNLTYLSPLWTVVSVWRNRYVIHETLLMWIISHALSVWIHYRSLLNWSVVIPLWVCLNLFIYFLSWYKWLYKALIHFGHILFFFKVIIKLRWVWLIKLIFRAGFLYFGCIGVLDSIFIRIRRALRLIELMNNGDFFLDTIYIFLFFTVNSLCLRWVGNS